MEEKIAQVFQKGPWTHEQVTRDGELTIYRRWKDSDQGQPVAVHYEVVRIAHQSAHIGGGGIVYAAKELYPPSRSWGTHGWTYTTLPEALTKFRSLLQSDTTAQPTLAEYPALRVSTPV